MPSTSRHVLGVIFMLSTLLRSPSNLQHLDFKRNEGLKYKRMAQSRTGFLGQRGYMATHILQESVKGDRDELEQSKIAMTRCLCGSSRYKVSSE